MTKRERLRRAKKRQLYQRACKALTTSLAQLRVFERCLKEGEATVIFVPIAEIMEWHKEGLRALRVHATRCAGRYGLTHPWRSAQWKRLEAAVDCIEVALDLRIAGLVTIQQLYRLTLRVKRRNSEVADLSRVLLDSNREIGLASRSILTGKLPPLPR